MEDVDGAVEVLVGLDNPAVHEWVQNARKRLDAEAATRAIRQHAKHVIETGVLALSDLDII